MRGRLACELEEIGSFIGQFTGRIDVVTGEIKGKLQCNLQYSGSEEEHEKIIIGVNGCLRPWRRVNVTQVIDNVPIGGITIQIQVSMDKNPDSICYMDKLPPTDTHYSENIR